MRLKRRRHLPELDPDFVETVSALWRAFEVDLERADRLTELRAAGALSPAARAEALAGAGNLAHLSRLVFKFIMYVVPLDTIPEGFLPIGVLGAVARLSYALLSLGEEAPEPEALLSADELRGLVKQYELEHWIQMWRNSEPGREPQPEAQEA